MAVEMQGRTRVRRRNAVATGMVGATTVLATVIGLVGTWLLLVM